MKPSMEFVLSGRKELAYMNREVTLDGLLARQRLANAHEAFSWRVRELALSAQGWAENLRKIIQAEAEAEARVHEWKGDWLWP